MNNEFSLTTRQQYERIRADLWTERSSFDSHWQELAQYIFPRRTRFWQGDRNKGDRRNQKIIDSTGTRAARNLRSGLHAGLTSPARPWMRLTTPDPDLAEFGPVKQWLHTVTQRMLTVFLRSNLYNVLPTVYGDMGSFGTAAMAVMEDDKDLMRCYAYPVGSYALGMSSRQIVDTFVREYQLTVSQLIEMFALMPGNTIDWSKVSYTVKNLWDNGNHNAAVDVCWIVTPNLGYDASKLEARFKPYASTWFEKGQEEEKFLRQSGFDEMPILAPRWDVTAEDSYGTDCPGMTALGDIKALQLMQRRKAQLVEKGINPPLQAPPSVRNQKVSLLPGDISYADTTQAGGGIRSIHEVQLAAVQFLTADIQDTRMSVSKAFYEDLFLMLAQTDNRQPITAREVEERHEEKLLALGPVLERTNDELLDPLVDRAYEIMRRAGLIPPPPEELNGVELRVEYVSVMAQAQKLVGVVGLDRFVQSTVPLVEQFPEVRHKLSSSAIINEYNELLGVNPKLVVPDDEAAAAFREDQQRAQQQMQAEQMAVASQSAKNLAQAPTNGDNALSKMLEGVQQ